MAETVTYDLVIKAGATFRRLFIWQTADGAPVPLTGYEARLQVRPRPGDAQVLLTIDSASTSAGASLVLDFPAGEVHLRIGATKTSALTKGVYDLELYKPTDPDEVECLSQGKVLVSK